MNPFVADPEWGWWIIVYFYLGGLAAGAYFLATLIALFGHADDRPLSRLGDRLAFPLIAVCGVLLIVDLERPERFWHMMVASEVVDLAIEEGWPWTGGWGTMMHAPLLKWWSPMSIGAWALGLFGACSVLSFLGSLWPDGRLDRGLGRGLAGRLFQVVGTLVGFFVASYTGVLLTATNQPLWSVTEWIGPLFLTSAASAGAAALLLLSERDPRVPAAARARLARADLWAMRLELFLFLIFLASLGHLLPWALTTGPGWVLVFGTPLVGLLLPLGLHLAHRPRAAAVGALVGGLFLRYGVVQVGPALLERWVEHGEAPAAVPLWQSPAGLALLAGTLLLAVAIPWTLRRQWALTGGPTALAGLASLLVVAGVGYYSLAPVSEATGPMPAALASPEDARPRGGGPGASAANRPQPVHLRTKMTGTLPHEQ